MKTKLLGLVAFMSLLDFSPASANTIYTYTGNDFTITTGAYTTSDQVTGTIDLATALGDNFGPSFISPVSFSFSDGVQTLTNLTAGLDANFLGFSTDASGNIVTWIVLMNEPFSLLNYEIYTEKPNPTDAFSSDGGYYATTNEGYVLGNPSMWTAMSQTPIPAALPLFASGLGAIGLLGWRRKRKAAALADQNN